jgi:hypothetical protein
MLSEDAADRHSPSDTWDPTKQSQHGSMSLTRQFAALTTTEIESMMSWLGERSVRRADRDAVPAYRRTLRANLRCAHAEIVQVACWLFVNLLHGGEEAG